MSRLSTIYSNYGKIMYLTIIYLVLHKHIVVTCICVPIHKFIINNKEVTYIVENFFHKNKCLKMYLFLFFSRFPENWLTMIWWNKWYRRFLMWCLTSMNRCSLISPLAYCLLVDSLKIHTISPKIKIRPESFILLWWFRSFSSKVNRFFYMTCK